MSAEGMLLLPFTHPVARFELLRSPGMLPVDRLVLFDCNRPIPGGVLLNLCGLPVLRFVLY